MRPHAPYVRQRVKTCGDASPSQPLQVRPRSLTATMLSAWRPRTTGPREPRPMMPSGRSSKSSIVKSSGPDVIPASSGSGLP
eukprot:scaffold8701_cov120-Isochrysis_galbana.AAC.6